MALGRYGARPIRSLTQEDPIGLAGGLNLYGFANGDPVTFSDPFGLCPSKERPNTICVAFFIQSPTVFPGLRGDNRSFSSNSDPKRSRGYIVIDVKNRSVVDQGASPSCTVGGSCSKSPSPFNQLGASFGPDGNILVSWQGSDSKTIVPMVSAFLQFTPNNDGSFDVAGFATDYPSIEAYHFDAQGKSRTLLQRTESSSSLCAIFCGVNPIGP